MHPHLSSPYVSPSNDSRALDPILNLSSLSRFFLEQNDAQHTSPTVRLIDRQTGRQTGRLSDRYLLLSHTNPELKSVRSASSHAKSWLPGSEEKLSLLYIAHRWIY